MGIAWLTAMCEHTVATASATHWSSVCSLFSCDSVAVLTDDAVSIFSTYIGKEAATPVHVSTDVREAVIVSICMEDGYLSPRCFQPAVDHVRAVLDRVLFAEFVQHSADYCKNLLAVATTPALQLCDVLANDVLLAAFMEFMDAHRQRHLVEFWLAVKMFRANAVTDTAMPAKDSVQNDAMVLYEK